MVTASGIDITTEENLSPLEKSLAQIKAEYEDLEIQPYIPPKEEDCHYVTIGPTGIDCDLSDFMIQFGPPPGKVSCSGC